MGWFKGIFIFVFFNTSLFASVEFRPAITLNGVDIDSMSGDISEAEIATLKNRAADVLMRSLPKMRFLPTNVLNEMISIDLFFWGSSKKVFLNSRSDSHRWDVSINVIPVLRLSKNSSGIVSSLYVSSIIEKNKVSNEQVYALRFAPKLFDAATVQEISS